MQYNNLIEIFLIGDAATYTYETEWIYLYIEILNRIIKNKTKNRRTEKITLFWFQMFYSNIFFQRIGSDDDMRIRVEQIETQHI